MKFNEREIGFFAANPDSAVDKQGYLGRRSDRSRDGYKQRWFVLKGNLLFYFKSEIMLNEQPMGCVVLERVCITVHDEQDFASPTKTFGFRIEFDGPGTHVHYLTAPDADSRKSWMEALKTASYEHLRSILLDLQRKLTQLTGRDPLRMALEGVVHPQVSAKESKSAAARLDVTHLGSIADRSASIRASISSRRTLKRPTMSSGVFERPPSVSEPRGATALDTASATKAEQDASADIVPETATKAAPPPRPDPPSALTSRISRASIVPTLADFTLGVEELKLPINAKCSVTVWVKYPGNKDWLEDITTEAASICSGCFVTTTKISVSAPPSLVQLRFVAHSHLQAAGDNGGSIDLDPEEEAAHAAAAEAKDEADGNCADAAESGFETQTVELGQASCSLLQVMEAADLLKLSLVHSETGDVAGILTVDETEEDEDDPSDDEHAHATSTIVRSTSSGELGNSLSPPAGRLATSSSVSAGSSPTLAAKSLTVPDSPRAAPLTKMNKRSYRFPALDGSNLKVTELMIESPFQFPLPKQLLQMYMDEDQDLVRDLADLGRLLGAAESARQAKMKMTYERIQAYADRLAFLESYNETTFKPSVKKKSTDLEMVTTNCHVQAIKVTAEAGKGRQQSRASSSVDSYAAITLGIPAAHSMGFKHGGLARILESRATQYEQADTPLVFDSPDQVRGEIEHVRSLEAEIEEQKTLLLVAIEEEAPQQVFEKTLAAVSSATERLQGFIRRPKISESITRAADYRPARTTSAVTRSSHSIGIQATDLLASIGNSLASLQEAVLAVMEDPSDQELIKALHESVVLFQDAARQVCLEMIECLFIIELLFETVAPWPQDLRHRRDIVFSQGLSAVVTVFVAEFKERVRDATFWLQMQHLGFLAQMESLLSTHADEMSMMEDFLTGIEDLNRVTLKFCESPQGTLYEMFVTGDRMETTVTIGVSPNMLACMPPALREGGGIRVTVVMFSQGVNEMQTLANKIGDTELQEKINAEHLERLAQYVSSFKEYVQHLTKKVKHPSQLPDTSRLDKLMANLKKAICAKKPKNIEILTLAEAIVRILRGGRMTCCKSGKDRTSMSVTLEQCNILIEKHKMLSSVLQHALDAMRSVGTRRDNVEKNIKEKRYAFNKLQVFSLPKLYRPPIGTFGSTIT
eukprot:m.265874 g.265874  ORF g.265874 m.265874 type:complete len:1155 (-) comp19266_c3_seq1:47-3511(-)